MNDVSQSTFSLYLIGQNIWAYLTQDCIVLVTPLVLGLSSSHVTVHLQEDNVPWFQHYSTRAAIIIPFLSTSFEYILPACFIECFRKTLLECNDKIINTHHMPFSYCGKMEVYGEPRVVPKQKIMWAVARDSRPHSVVGLNQLRQMFRPIGLFIL